MLNFLYTIGRPLLKKYQEVARNMFLSTGDEKRKVHVDLQDKVTGLYLNIRLFQKGVEKFPGMYKLHFVITEKFPYQNLVILSMC